MFTIAHIIVAKNMCCPMNNKPDFLDQKRWLTTVVEAAGFTIMFSPKYYFDTNLIEMLWGWWKSHHCRTCTYNYHDIKERLPITLLKMMSLAFVKRAARFCLRFMSGYRAGLSRSLFGFIMKKYNSHSTIPFISQQFDEYVQLKLIKLINNVTYVFNYCLFMFKVHLFM
jgi:hypothetical protein